MPAPGSWKSIKISPGSHRRLMELANHYGCSVDTVLQNVLSRMTPTGEIMAGHCVHCHKLYRWSTWNELDGAITTTVKPHHAECHLTDDTEIIVLHKKGRD